MASSGAPRPVSETPVEGYRLAFADDFDGPRLDPARWLPAYLPQWSSRERAAARYELRDGELVLRVEADQPPWCPELDGDTRVSSVQTGVYAGPVGSAVGQHRFHPDAVVREAQEPLRLHTPQFGWIEARAKVPAHPRAMAALWMIGYEDAPERSGEICVFEIFGSERAPGGSLVGMGVHPFGDPALRDDFAKVALDIDVTDFHVYAAEWTPDAVHFLVDGRRVRTVPQSPAYPMQLMLGVYEFGRDGARAPDETPDEAPIEAPDEAPIEFTVDYVRVFQSP